MRRWYSLCCRLAAAFLSMILFAQEIQAFIADPLRIPPGAMMPMLLAGNNILVSKFADMPSRGELVALRCPDMPFLSSK